MPVTFNWRCDHINHYLCDFQPSLCRLLQSCLIATCLWSIASEAGELPEAFSADYRLNRGIITLAKTHRSLQKIGDNRYVFKSVTKPSGVGKMLTNGEIKEQSIWQYHNNAIRPLKYLYNNTSKKKKRDVQLLFDWEKKKVTNIINGDPWKMDLQPDVQDKLLYQLKLMRDLNKGKRHLEYKVADGGTLKTYKTMIEGEVPIETDIGIFNTIKIVRTHNDGRKTTFWCAPALKYIPVQIEQTKKDGGKARAVIYNLTGIPIPKTALIEEDSD